jgi:hypothetical protein
MYLEKQGRRIESYPSEALLGLECSPNKVC